MHISIIQPNLVWEDKTANFNNLSRLISPLFNKTDIVVLPEMFNTGFSMDTEKLCELSGGETFEWMMNLSQNGNFGICGSYIVKENDNFYNRWIFISPEKEFWKYDKRHLFSMGGEDKSFTRGKTRLLFTFRGLRISPYICYDLRFPVWSRNRNDCDMLIYAANWPNVRQDAWNILLKARAIENQCFVAGSNRVGSDNNGLEYCGDSMLISPKGEVIKSANLSEECSLTGDISLTELFDFRKKFPVQNDVDSFNIDY
jgi:omega-amidase